MAATERISAESEMMSIMSEVASRPVFSPTPSSDESQRSTPKMIRPPKIRTMSDFEFCATTPGEFHDQADAKWKVIRGLLRGHKSGAYLSYENSLALFHLARMIAYDRSDVPPTNIGGGPNRPMIIY
jgi:hypothetical protein